MDTIKKKQKITVVTEDMNRWELLEGMYNGAATVDNKCGNFSKKKFKMELSYNPATSLLGIQEKWPRGWS